MCGRHSKGDELNLEVDARQLYFYKSPKTHCLASYLSHDLDASEDLLLSLIRTTPPPPPGPDPNNQLAVSRTTFNSTQAASLNSRQDAGAGGGYE